MSSLHMSSRVGSTSSPVENCRVWLSFSRNWHRQPVELQTANDGIEQQQTALLITKSRGHFMRTALDFLKESLHDIVGPDRLPMLFGKGIKGQTLECPHLTGQRS